MKKEDILIADIEKGRSQILGIAKLASALFRSFWYFPDIFGGGQF
jgi:hypothetical protein